MCKITEGLKQDFKQMHGILVDTMNENEQLKRYNKLVNASIEYTNDIVYVLDIETDKVIMANKNAEKIFGIKEGEKVDRTLYDCESLNDKEINSRIIEDTGKAYYWTAYNSKLGKLFLIMDVAFMDGDRIMRFERAINLNGETRSIIQLANKHNIV